MQGSSFRVGLIVDGAPVGITPPSVNAHEFAWMPDGDHLLIATRHRVGGPDQLVVANLEGEVTNTIRLTRALRLETGMTVASDGRSAFVSGQPPGEGEAYSDLYSVNLKDGSVKRITSTPHLGEDFPVLVGDSKLAFTSGRLVQDSLEANGRISLLDLTNGAVRAVTPPSQVAGTATVIGDEPWTLLYTAFDKEDRASASLWTTTLRSDVERAVETASRFPNVNADGTRVVLSAVGTPSSPGGLEIWDTEALVIGTHQK